MRFPKLIQRPSANFLPFSVKFLKLNLYICLLIVLVLILIVIQFQSSQKSCQLSTLSMIASSLDIKLLHKRLGHPAVQILHNVIKNWNKFTVFNKNKSLLFYNACHQGKNHRLHFNSVSTKTTEPLQLVYADFWGFSHITSTQGYSYIPSFH